MIGAPAHAPHHLVDHGNTRIRKDSLYFAGEGDKGGESTPVIETGQVLGADNRRLPRDGHIDGEHPGDNGVAAIGAGRCADIGADCEQRTAIVLERLDWELLQGSVAASTLWQLG